MSYAGKIRGRRKAVGTIKMVHDGLGNVDIYQDSVLRGGGPFTINGTWAVIYAAFAADSNYVEIFDDTGIISRIGDGGVGAEVDQWQIPPGGNGDVEVQIVAGTRLTMRYDSMMDAAINTVTIFNFFD